MKTILAGLLLSLAAMQAGAWQDKALTGSYNIAGKTMIDPPDTEARDTHLYIALSGEAARDLYTSMKVAARPDACLGNGSVTKSIGKMRCTRAAGGKVFQCGFGIDIASQRIIGGSVC